MTRPGLTSVQFPVKTLERVRAIAAEDGDDASGIINRAVEQFIFLRDVTTNADVLRAALKHGGPLLKAVRALKSE